MNKKYVILIFVLLFPLAHGLAVGGSKMTNKFMFEPNGVYEYEYYFTNNDGISADYNLFAENKKGSDLVPYFTITPEIIPDVASGETRHFKIRLKLPETLETPGENIARVWVRGVPEGAQGMTAFPVVGVSFKIFVLFPYKYVEWRFSSSTVNENQSSPMIINVQNLGEPTIDALYGDIDIINIETNESVGLVRTNVVTNFVSRASTTLKADFDTVGQMPGNYRAVAKLKFDNKEEYRESTFRIGTLFIEILSHTSEFEKDAINKMGINVKSHWNTKVDILYADIEILDNEGATIRAFRSFKSELNPWSSDTLEAYFDTSGLGLGEYTMRITLRYEGSYSVKESKIKIIETADTETVEKIPGQFDLGISPAMLILILILVIFLIINIGFMMRYRKKETKDEVKSGVDEIIKKLK